MDKELKIVGTLSEGYPSGILDIYSHEITTGIKNKKDWLIKKGQIMHELGKIEITREKEGSVSLIVNGEKIETKNTIGIHLDINCQDDMAYLELTRVERVAMLNFGKPLDTPPRNNG